MTWENRFTFEVDAPAVFDGFTRTTSSSWGTTDSGQTWGQVGTAADFSVSAGLGRHAHPTAGSMRESFLDVGSPDFDVTVDLAWPVNFATSAILSRWICGRYTDANNYYVARLDLTTAGTVVLGLSRRISGTLTTLVADVTMAATYAAGTMWRVRFAGTGTSLMARAWLPTSFEPDVWTIQTTDSTLTAGTGVALLSRAEAGNINVPLTLTWDNFVVASPSAWVDLTLRIRDEVQPIDWASGRQNNLDQTEPGQLTLLLDNSDGVVTFGNTASPYASWWGPGRMCRLRERVGQFTFDHFAGYLQMPEENSVTEGIEQRVAVTATDRLARLNAGRAFISNLAEHVIFSGGTTLKAYWPLNDRAPFMSVVGTAAYPTVTEFNALNFGVATASSGAPAVTPSSTEGPLGEDVSFASYTMRVDTVGGLQRPAQSAMTRAVIPSGSPITLPAGTMLTVVAWIYSPWTAIDTESTPLMIRFTDPAVGVIALVRQDGIAATWLVEVSGATALAASFAGSVAPTNRWTQVAIRFCFNPNVIELWVDGALSATGTLTGAAPTSAQITDVFMPEQSFDGSVAHVQLYMGAAADFSLTTFAAQRAMALTGLERQTTGERIRTVAQYAGMPLSQLAYVDTGVAVMQVAHLAGKDPLTAMREAETTEQGLLYVDGSGNLVFADRRRLYNI